MLLIFDKEIKIEIEHFLERKEEYHKGGYSPQISVIIVAYNSKLALIDCLNSLQNQTFSEFEIIIIDNGKNEPILKMIKQFKARYFKLRENYGPSLARNIGISQAQAELVCFLDDDAIAKNDFVENHYLALTTKDCFGARGRVLPKSDCLYNFLSSAYDLGDQIIPSYIDIEGNASFRKQILNQVGGFNPKIFSGEGAELSYRIVENFGYPEKLLYWPGAVIYHNYSNNLAKIVRKTCRGAKMRLLLESIHPDFWSFIKSYHPFPKGNMIRKLHYAERIQVAILRRLIRQVNRICSDYYSRRLDKTYVDETSQ